MNSIFIPLIKQVQKLRAPLETIKKTLAIEDLSDSFLQELNTFEENCKYIHHTLSEASTHRSFDHVMQIAHSAKNIARKFENTDQEKNPAVIDLEFLANSLLIETKSIELDFFKNEFEALNSELANIKREFKEASAEHSNNTLSTTKEIANAKNLLATMEADIGDLRRLAEREIKYVVEEFQDAKNYLSEKRKEIDGLLEDSASQIIAGDYKKSAAIEKKAADLFRISAISCMALICIILTEITLSTLNSDLDWKRALARISIAFLLSVPAAYLARESAKHREQQYHFQQTSLDTKAIAPFISSLPDEEQHKIKSAVATKLFAGRDFSKVGIDPFPINLQEILIEILKNADITKKNTKKTDS